MVLLKLHLAVALVALLLSGCKFDPAVYGLGYQKCDSTAECIGGGLVCLKGLCVPDCQGAYTVARLGPDSEDDTGDYFKKLCPGALCETSPEYLDVELPPGTFLDMGSMKTKEELGDCNVVVIRFSILVPKEKVQGRELSVVIRGPNATGVVHEEEGGVISLQLFEPDEDLDERFREETHFYVVSQEIFGWPVGLRLVPIANNTTAYFWIRDFEMSCCN
jgi:hypothetical protein